MRVVFGVLNIELYLWVYKVWVNRYGFIFIDIEIINIKFLRF